MTQKNTYTEIRRITVSIIDSTLLIGAVLGLIAFLVSLVNYSESVNKVSYYVDFSVISVLIGISLFLKKISIEIKSILIIVGLFLVIISDVLKMGVYSDNKAFIIIIPFYSFLIYSLRKTVIIYFLVILSFLFIGYLHLSGIIKPGVDITIRSFAISPWIINVVLLSIVSFIVVVIMKRYSEAYMGVISDLELSHKKTVEQEQNYREIFNSSTDAIFIHDLHGKIIDVNESTLSMYGYELNEILNVDIAELSAAKNGYTAEGATVFIKKAILGAPQVFDWQAKKKNGDVFWVEVALKKSNIAGNDRVLAIIRDINDKKEDELQLKMYRNHLKELVAQRTRELEQTNEELNATNDNLAQQKEELMTTLNKLKNTQDQLVQSEKLASLGILAAGVAHEINNPLNFIQGGLYGLENYFEDNLKEHQENTKPLLSAIGIGIERAADIVTSLDQYSKTGNSKLEKCDLHDILDNSLFMLHNKTKNKAEIKKEYTNVEHKLVANKGQLHQVIVNVLLNAAQAIEKKGVIKIRTEIIDHTIKLSVKDTGSGIDQENLLKIFDPFYTTKEAGEGTGLGMSISLKIIEDHHGTIKYNSELNKGTEAIITLPLN